MQSMSQGNQNSASHGMYVCVCNAPTAQRGPQPNTRPKSQGGSLCASTHTDGLCDSCYYYYYFVIHTASSSVDSLTKVLANVIHIFGGQYDS